MCQSFNGKICELGLKKIYENDPELSLTLRMIRALSFVPEPMVLASFDLVIEEIQEVCEIAKIDTECLQMKDDLTSYFQSTYIRGEKLAGSIENLNTLWHSGTTTKMQLKAWQEQQMQLKAGIWGLHPFFKATIPAFGLFRRRFHFSGEDAANQKFNIIKALSGKENKSGKKYRVLNENVKNITKNFKTDDIVPNLRSLAYYTHS